MLDTGQEDLFEALKKAFEKAAETGASSDPIPDLGDDVGTAIHQYALTAQVETTVDVSFGIAYNDPGGVVNPIGTTNKPGKGEGIGGPDTDGVGLEYESDAVNTLKSDLKQAYSDATVLGTKGGDVPEQLSKDISEIIYAFAVKAKVQTSVTMTPGQTIVGQLTGTPASPAPLAGSMTKEGKGIGIGTIS